MEAFEHFPLKNVLHIPIWITKYTAKTEIPVELKAWGYVGYTLMENSSRIKVMGGKDYWNLSMG